MHATAFQRLRRLISTSIAVIEPLAPRKNVSSFNALNDTFFFDTLKMYTELKNHAFSEGSASILSECICFMIKERAKEAIESRVPCSTQFSMNTPIFMIEPNENELLRQQEQHELFINGIEGPSRLATHISNTLEPVIDSLDSTRAESGAVIMAMRVEAGEQKQTLQISLNQFASDVQMIGSRIRAESEQIKTRCVYFVSLGLTFTFLSIASSFSNSKS